MKRKMLIGIGILAMLAMTCGVAVLSTGVPDAVEAKKPSGSDGMIVFYKTSNSTYLFWCQLEGTDIIDQGGTWDVYSEQGTWIGVNKVNVTYGYYKYKRIDPNYVGSIDGLNLQPLGGMELPKSEHIGKLTAVNTSLAKPATVTRKYLGQLYDVQCLVSQNVVDMWLAGDLQIGDYVLVSFIDEIPNTTEVSVAIVTDKVYESW